MRWFFCTPSEFYYIQQDKNVYLYLFRGHCSQKGIRKSTNAIIAIGNFLKKRGRTMTRPNSIVSCIPETKGLINYLITISEKSPKRFRFTLVDRQMTQALDALTSLICANETFLGRCEGDNLTRLRYQQKALGHLSSLDALLQVSAEVGCILPKQYTECSRRIANIKYLIRKWMQSDAERIKASD